MTTGKIDKKSFGWQTWERKKIFIDMIILHRRTQVKRRATTYYLYCQRSSYKRMVSTTHNRVFYTELPKPWEKLHYVHKRGETVLFITYKVVRDEAFHLTRY